MDNGSNARPKVTVELDLGDRYSHLCLLDSASGEVLEECRLRTTPEALRHRFGSEQPFCVAIEAGTHSPWVSRLCSKSAAMRGPGGQPTQAQADLRRKTKDRQA